MKNIIITIILLIATVTGYGKVGDTTIIQTIDHSTPVLNWWNAPRDGRYNFPTDKRWEKILMYYNLKCDPTQNPKCGEWDYLTYTTLIEHTGVFENQQLEHVWFVSNGKAADKIEYINEDVAYRYTPVLERKMNYTSTNSLVSNIINLGSSNITIPFNASKNARMLSVYKASEITQYSDSKKITGLNLTVSPDNKCTSARIKVEIKKGGTLALPASIEKMTTVYYATVAITPDSKLSLYFTQPFSWDGSSDITVSYSFENMDDDLVLIGAANITDDTRDMQFTRFDGTADMGYGNYIDIPVAQLNSMLNDEITISFWAYGNPAYQPKEASFFEAVDAKGERLLNCHLPWSDGKIYWDCFGGRLSKASRPADWEGTWTHWTLTRSASGAMSIYINGKTFGVGTGNSSKITGIDRFRIATSMTYGPSYYGGAIDDFYIFNKALSKAEVSDMMYKGINAENPLYGNLVLGYNFDETEGTVVTDIKGGSNAIFTNNTTRKPQGSERFKDYQTAGCVPNVELEFRDYEGSQEKSVTEDITLKYKEYMVFYKVEDNKIVIDQTQLVTPVYWKNYVYDQDGKAIDSTKVAVAGEYINKKLQYYGEPVEKTIEWEIGRYITPYGNGLDLGNDGWTWIYDVTDFAPLLKGNVHLRAGNWQELLDLKFIMIEGVPDRDVVAIESAWKGRYISLKNFDEVVTEKEFTLPQNAKMMKLRTTVTGHEFDNSTNCAEFCDKLHSIWVNGVKQREWQIIKPCGANPLYPQGGTWIYDRAGWCPGEPAVTEQFELTDYIVDGKVKVDYNIQSDPYGFYDTDSNVIYYTDLNHQIDMAMDEILTPNNMKIYSRINPSCGDVTVVIHNKGKQTLTQATINYGLEGKQMSSYNWTGNLKYNQRDTVVMPAPVWDYTLTSGRFYAEVVAQGDVYPTNNSRTVTYDNVRMTERADLQFKFKTNKKPKDTKWELINLGTGWSATIDVNDLEPVTEYTYNWELTQGCYRLALTDYSGDGLSFWALSGNGSGAAELFSKIAGSDEEYKSFYKFNPDFGSFIYYDFIIDIDDKGVNNLADKYNVKLFPNPANDYVNVNISGYVADRIIVYDITGKIVLEDNTPADSYQLNIEQFDPGIYMIKLFLHDNNTVTKKMIKK